jgi:hypothetical protein
MTQCSLVEITDVSEKPTAHPLYAQSMFLRKVHKSVSDYGHYMTAEENLLGKKYSLF